VAGDCYFTPLWLEAASVELGSGQIHLSSGRVRAFNFSSQQVRIVVESGQYNVAALPSEVTEASFNDDGDVVFFSKKGNTTLAVSYEASQRTLREGEGIVVGLTPPKSNEGCTVAATWATLSPSSSDSKGAVRIRPPGSSQGGWVMVGLGLAGLALIWTRKWTGSKGKRSAAE
jgi:hypothetical protein